MWIGARSCRPRPCRSTLQLRRREVRLCQGAFPRHRGRSPAVLLMKSKDVRDKRSILRHNSGAQSMSALDTSDDDRPASSESRGFLRRRSRDLTNFFRGLGRASRGSKDDLAETRRDTRLQGELRRYANTALPSNITAIHPDDRNDSDDECVQWVADVVFGKQRAPGQVIIRLPPNYPFAGPVLSFRDREVRFVLGQGGVRDDWDIVCVWTPAMSVSRARRRDWDMFAEEEVCVWTPAMRAATTSRRRGHGALAAVNQAEFTDAANMLRAEASAGIHNRRAALLSLPADMLCKIAPRSAPDLVVAAGRDVSARTALRKGTDAAERSRFGGIGLTVREAEQVLRTLSGLASTAENRREGLGQDLIVRSATCRGIIRMLLQHSREQLGQLAVQQPSLHTERRAGCPALSGPPAQAQNTGSRCREHARVLPSSNRVRTAVTTSTIHSSALLSLSSPLDRGAHISHSTAAHSSTAKVPTAAQHGRRRHS